MSLNPTLRSTLPCRWPFAAVLLSVLAALPAAQAPAGYYASVDTTDGTTLRNTLHEVIDDHTRFPYTAGSTDTWNILELADENPGNPSQIVDIYMNATFTKVGGGNSFYNREHVWPKSYGFPNDGSTNYPYTDCHALHLCDDGYNSSRSNKPYRNCTTGCSEQPTVANNGEGGGTGVYPGNSNWTSGSFTTGTWEVWNARKGDIARTMLYLDVRYQGGTHNVTGASEPDLILTDSQALIDSSNTGNNESVGYMGMLSVLLSWHAQDPVDAFEMNRNDVVFSFQGNRNPFVDHPEWVDCIFSGNCSGGLNPPTNVMASAGDGVVDLSWDASGAPNLAGYNVYRSTTMGSGYAQLNGVPVVPTSYSDTSVSNGTTYYYVVTVEDTLANESGFSLEVDAQPDVPLDPSMTPWINELHYDNIGADTGEFVEIAGPAGLDLAGWSLRLYNGSGGSQYASIALSGVFADQAGCAGALSFPIAGIQNGNPDGLALVSPTLEVLEFLSYEGTFTASGGPAAGMLSTQIPVAESDTTTAAGNSLQRLGVGQGPGDFTWSGPASDSPGSLNAGQTVELCCPTLASATFRNSGSNPASLTASAPVLGQMWTATVDLTTTGHASAVIFGYVGQANIVLAGGQVVLVNPASSSELFHLPLLPGPLVQINLLVPSDPALCGAMASAQAAHIGTVPVVLFSNAIDMVAGQ